MLLEGKQGLSVGYESEVNSQSVHRTRRVVHTTQRVVCSDSPEKMKSGQRGQQPPREQREFPWNNFPEVVSQRVLAEWWKNLEKMKKKEFYIANEVN
uniref:Uncharacterized protein n=1 Tax=Lactuca sativa TaxID=4236 RepID=A0A9R1UU20_LACSA|nr:hypothetical protein LSAT_V11C800439440 [Lactuca sativa]